MIIGICGKSGSGKSTLARSIEEVSTREVAHLDIDKVGHNALKHKEVIDKLINTFGKDIVIEGRIDRKKLGDIVFDSKDEMSKLTDITWGYMQKEIDKFLLDNKDKIIILDWQLLPKTEYFGKCDIKILIDVPYEIRKERSIKRDSISSDVFDLREKASIDYDKDKFDYILGNSEKENIKKKVKL